MFKYQNDNPLNFHDKQGNSTMLPCSIIILIQLAVAFSVEWLNVLVIIEQGTVMDVIMNFISLQIISQVDAIYFAALNKEPLKGVIEEPPEIGNNTENLRVSGRSKMQLVFRKVYKFLKFIYASYYYYMPFALILLIFKEPPLLVKQW